MFVAASAPPTSSSGGDGYNWRKYGQKNIKGHQLTRNYYKCTYPGCRAKKQEEKNSTDNKCSIQYKGRHVHALPVAKGENTKRLEDIEPGKSNINALINKDDETDNYLSLEEFTDSELSKQDKSNSAPDISAYYDDEYDDANAHTVVIEADSMDKLLSDGYQWKKYGQKYVRGSVYPKSYYKCTTSGCQVKKPQVVVLASILAIGNNDVLPPFSSSSMFMSMVMSKAGCSI
ncbi:hypothetical protein SAMD00019534_043210 [Acytostelium subglobosum LB1]|uniref:hypothetical protein n=1 Tax=Acytostelium subglobosum LB1 TaxID=1410327 RepID=UPI000644C6B9|nr:hypothetical protein SAMD00019534_043210 [Acytostelium subglobosum LB1]GAM21146.1 hypothetical protein SAMD00019534_043210 [Acytostelium subglobosum LB1]|eukprot:XP_012756280.1 hypothetical protein SAMD00019534_043210 [Acytostelium subglobosum LB1]